MHIIVKFKNNTKWKLITIVCSFAYLLVGIAQTVYAATLSCDDVLEMYWTIAQTIFGILLLSIMSIHRIVVIYFLKQEDFKHVILFYIISYHIAGLVNYFIFAISKLVNSLFCYYIMNMLLTTCGTLALLWCSLTPGEDEDCLQDVLLFKNNIFLFCCAIINTFLFFPFQAMFNKSLPIFGDWTFETFGNALFHCCILMGSVLARQKCKSKPTLYALVGVCIVLQASLVVVSNYLVVHGAQYFVLCTTGLIHILNGYVNTCVCNLLQTTKQFEIQFLILFHMVCHLIGVQFSVTFAHIQLNG
jgi:hypothetical protein